MDSVSVSDRTIDSHMRNLRAKYAKAGCKESDRDLVHGVGYKLGPCRLDGDKSQRAWRFKLRTILLAVSLAVLILPLGGVYVFRFYEGELVKQTEVELIAQAAMISAVYRREIETLLMREGGVAEYGRQSCAGPE